MKSNNKEKNTGQQEQEKENEKNVKEKYLMKLKKGVLIAFYDKKGKPRTGKAVAKNSKTKLVQVETEYNKLFTIEWSKVIWVKTGSRWPKGVISELKGEKRKDEQSKDKE